MHAAPDRSTSRDPRRPDRTGPRLGRPAAALGVLAALLATLLPGALPAADAAPTRSSAPGAAAAALVAGSASTSRPRSDRTSPQEARRVDRVRVRLRWSVCQEQFRCSTARLPLDYDRPRGKKVRVALLKYPARTSHRIGTLFVNPGGPGGSGTELAALAPLLFPPSILDRFDIVGFDPRGIRVSTPVKCFDSVAAQTRALAPLTTQAFPADAAGNRTFLKAFRSLGRACNTTGRPLAAAMSSAQVARDMDVLRRAVGDRRLSYLGFSYGTALGQIYANLFPDRMRAMVMDGVLDPIRWTGRQHPKVPLGARLRSADGTWRALRETLVRCGTAGPSRCPLAARGDTQRSFAVLAARLRAAPITDPTFGTVDYPTLVAVMAALLYSPGTGELIAQLTDELLTVSDPATRAPARRRATARLHTALGRAKALTAPVVATKAATYDNSLETFPVVSCTDTRSRNRLQALPGAARRADARAPYFGSYWTWALPCSRNTFKVSDEDAYRGGFRHRTRARLLFVGDTYDPATRYQGAVRASRLAPHSRLISSDSWGHTAFGTSACVDGAVVGYLLRPRASAPRVTRCVGDYQPFAGTTTPSSGLLVSRLLVPPVR